MSDIEWETKIYPEQPARQSKSMYATIDEFKVAIYDWGSWNFHCILGGYEMSVSRKAPRGRLTTQAEWRELQEETMQAIRYLRNLGAAPSRKW